MIVDRHPQAAQTSRACVIHARTLEVLEPLGVTSELLTVGVRVPIFRIRDRDRVLATIDFSDIDSAYPFTLMYPQDRTERLLLAALERIGGGVERPVDMVGFRAEGDGIATTLDVAGTRTRVESPWLVGCDGMHSAVREQAGIGFDGAAYEQGFVLADLSMSWPLSREEVSLFYSPQGLVVVAPLPDDRFRIVATDDAAPEFPSKEYVQALLDCQRPRRRSGTRSRRRLELALSHPPSDREHAAQRPDPPVRRCRARAQPRRRPGPEHRDPGRHVARAVAGMGAARR